jgi:pilus assembly protein FimV
LKKISMKLSQLALASLSAVTVLMSAAPAHALGLGRLNVQSSLGESLNAEIDIASMTPEEAASLQVRIASPETYRAAGVEYHPALASARVQLARRADGRPYLRVIGDRPVNEPFVDVILELNWAAGRLVREYTLLLDPSRSAVAQAPAAPATPAQLSAPAPSPAPQPAVAAAEPSPAAVQQPEPVAVTRSTTVTESGIRITVEPIDPSAPPRAVAQPPARAAARVPAAPARRTAAAAPRPAARAADAAGQITVRRGDTLSKLARQVQPEGASLDQMLVSMFRTNPEAFSGNNMNRLRAGAILRVPDAAEVQGTDATEARQMIVAQSADFNAYRRRFASNVAAAPSAPARQSGGQIQASVDDKKQAEAKTPDKLTLSQAATAAASAPEAKISLEAASKEASTRVAELSRNLDELKKVQGAASAEVAASATPTTGTAPAATAPAPLVVDAKPASADPAASAAPTVAEASPPAQPAAPVAPATPVEVDDRSWFAKVFESPYALPIGAGLAVLLAGFGIYRVRARSRNAAAETSFMESRIQPDSFFGASGGQRIDTHDGVAGTPADPASSSMTYSLSQLDAIGDVDPVAEADVYLAYGRDLQAEEILKEAMRSNPDRLEIRTKLLEVYSKRKDAKSFEALASQLFTLTGGAGVDWQRAQELGRGLDPSNPLYADGGRPAHAEEPSAVPTPPARVVDLDAVEDLPSRAASNVEQARAKVDATDIDIDLSFDAEPAKPVTNATWQSAPVAAAGAAAAAAAARAADVVDSKFPARAFQNSKMDSPVASNESAAFDLSDISLDLTKPADTQASKAAADRAAEARSSGFVDLSGLPDDPESQFNDDGDPLERKLELAEEFRQIGDLEGARDLLNEVIAGADGAVRQKAQTMLDNLR